MTNTQVRLYQDVDGCINAHQPQRWGRLANGHAKADGFEFHIRWAPAMIRALSELGVELVWATTWRNDAPTSLASLIGFGEGARVLHPNSDPYGELIWPSIDWKLPAVMFDQKRNPSPFIWVDDELEDSMIDWAVAAGGLAIRPNPMHGITPDHVALMQNYVAALAETEAVDA